MVSVRDKSLKVQCWANTGITVYENAVLVQPFSKHLEKKEVIYITVIGYYHF